MQYLFELIGEVFLAGLGAQEVIRQTGQRVRDQRNVDWLISRCGSHRDYRSTVLSVTVQRRSDALARQGRNPTRADRPLRGAGARRESSVSSTATLRSFGCCATCSA
jgi:hypothetical protein